MRDKEYPPRDNGKEHAQVFFFFLGIATATVRYASSLGIAKLTHSVVQI